MKKRILSLVAVAVLLLGMSVNVMAAGSSTAGTVDSVIVVATDNVMQQVVTTGTLEYFQKDTTVSGIAGATVAELPKAKADALAAKAFEVIGKGAFFASMVELNVPAGTGEATITMTCSNVWKGQKVKIFHTKSDGSIEVIDPISVEDNKVTFKMTSYSPIAIVVDAASPKTGDIFVAVAAMAALSGAGAVACAKKKN